MKWLQFTGDLGKFFITAVISFIASLLYTNYRLAPERNVNLVPLSIKVETSDLACAVDQKKLRKNIDQSKTASSLAKSDTYESYLLQLSNTSPSNIVLKEYVLQSGFLSRLEDDGILTCDQQVPENAAFSLEAATLFERPTPYLLKRSCSMKYQGVDIPIRLSADARLTNYGVTEPETASIRDTGNVFFVYDKSQSDVSRIKFDELKQTVKEADIEISVKCPVISPSKDMKIGGRPYTIPHTVPPTF